MSGTTAHATISGTISRRVSVPAVRNETVQPRKNAKNSGFFKPRQALIAERYLAFRWKHFD